MVYISSVSVIYFSRVDAIILRINFEILFK